MIALLLLLTTGDTTCASPALCALRDRAIAANGVPGNLASYEARVESELAVISIKPGLIDGPSSVEAYASDVTWERSGQFHQHAVGFRARNAGLPLSTVRFLLIGWVSPMTFGNHVPIFGRQTWSEHEGEDGSMDPRLVFAISPVGRESSRYYRFVRVDTVAAARFEGDTLHVFRVTIAPLNVPEERRLLFRGTVDLVPGTLQVARIRASVESSGTPFSIFRGLTSFGVPRLSFADLVNEPAPDGTWLPSVQRFEWQGVPAPGGTTSALRVVSTFRNLRTVQLAPGEDATFNDRPGFKLTSAPGDSLHRFREWSTALGEETSQRDVTDFSDLMRGIPFSGGQLFVPAPRNDETILRFNRIEGIYLGVPAAYVFKDGRSSMALHVNVGYAFAEDVIRWNLAFLFGSPQLGGEVRAGRTLEVTNKFRQQFDDASMGALLARDNWDYVDRVGGGVVGHLQLGQRRGNQLQAAVDLLEDQAVEQVLRTSPYVGWLRPNRGIYEGRYLRTQLQLDLNPDISSIFVRNGIGFQVLYEAGYGDLAYQRVEGRVVGRHDFKRLFLVARANVGMVFGDSVPPQQLFEIGGAAGLPGYQYKQFAGDRAALTRVRLTWPLPMLQAPIVVKPGITLPALTPSLSIGLQGAWTDISNPRVQAAVDRFGYMTNTGTGQPQIDPETGLPVPASVETDGLRGSIDIRAGLFNDALSLGVAHALSSPNSGLSVFLAFGRQF